MIIKNIVQCVCLDENVYVYGFDMNFVGVNGCEPENKTCLSEVRRLFIINTIKI